MKLAAFILSTFLLFAALEGEHIAASVVLLFTSAYLMPGLPADGRPGQGNRERSNS